MRPELPTRPGRHGASRREVPPGLVRLTGALCAAVLVVGGAAAGGLLDRGYRPPERWDPRVEPVAAVVERLRGLDFEHPVEVRFLSPEAYGEEVRDTGGGPPAEEEDQTGPLLRALGLASGPVDLAASTGDLLDGGTLAYYDPSAREVVVRGTELTVDVEVTLVHELVHVLQDQAFDLPRLQAEALDDGPGALTALLEGDALRIEDRYLAEELDADELDAYVEAATAGGEEARAELGGVPPVLLAVFAAPYVLGPGLVDVVDALDGVDDAFADPPSSEAHLLDPLAYVADEEPVDVDRPEAPDGATDVEDLDGLGPLALYQLLGARIDPRQALEATLGWAGDAAVGHRDDGRLCVTVDIEAEDPEAAGRLADALQAWAEAGPELDAEAVPAEASRTGLRSCDPGEDAELDGGEDPTALLSLPGNRSTLLAIALEQGLDADGAACFAGRVLDALPLDALLGLAELDAAASQAAVADASGACG